MKIRCIFGSLQVLTFCLLDIVCLRVLSISLGGVHREVLQQQEEETAQLHCKDGAICSLMPG